VIWFNVKKAYEYLVAHKMVYTLRPNLKRDGVHVFRTSFALGEERRVLIEKVAEVDMKDEKSIVALFRYVKNSGFSSVKDWILAAKSSDKYYLYKVDLLKEG